MAVARTGLDYAGVLATLRMQRVAPSEWPELFESIRLMEGAVLELWNQRAAK